MGRAVELRTLASYVDDVERLATRGEEAAVIPDSYRTWALARFFAANVAFCALGGSQAEASTGEPPG